MPYNDQKDIEDLAKSHKRLKTENEQLSRLEACQNEKLKLDNEFLRENYDKALEMIQKLKKEKKEKDAIIS